MPKLSQYKLSALPASPRPNSIYWIISGGSLSVYVTDQNGTAYQIAAGIEYGEGGGTEGYYQIVDADGKLVDGTFEQTQAGKIRSTGKVLELRLANGTYTGALLVLTSQDSGLSSSFKQGDGLAINTYSLGINSQDEGIGLLNLTSYNRQAIIEFRPVWSKTTADEITGNGTLTVSNPRGRIVISADASGYRIEGLSANQVDGMSVILENPTANTFDLRDENTNASAANRFNLPTATNYILPAFSSVILTYNGTLARWMFANYITP